MEASDKRKKPSAMWSNHVHRIAASVRREDFINDSAQTENLGETPAVSETNEAAPSLWNLPDAMLFNVLSFAAAPTHRAGVVCHQLAPLNRLYYDRFYNNTTLWEAILQADYGAARDENSSTSNNKGFSANKRRRCTRLDRNPLERVKEAHRLVKDNTEIAFYYLSELVNASTKKSGLTFRRFLSLLQEYGPHLRINQRTSTGGLYLVEIFRSKNVKETVILKCVQELVDNHGSLVNLQTFEAASAHQSALSVASARGMPTVVKYLLSKRASPDILSSGRFRLTMNPKKSVRCVNMTCLEFATEAKQAELEHGATARDLKALDECIELLKAFASCRHDSAN